MIFALNNCGVATNRIPPPAIQIPCEISRRTGKLEDYSDWKLVCNLCFVHNCPPSRPYTNMYLRCSVADASLFLGNQVWSRVLYSNVPVLGGILPMPYMGHYSLLVASMCMYLLSKDSVTRTDRSTLCLIIPGAVLSTVFMVRSHIQTLCPYTGFKSCVLKMHLLSHYTTVVKIWGPLWVYGCFAFESVNRQLSSAVFENQ